MVNYVHHLPGRLRIRIRSLKKNAVQAERIQQFFDPMPGIISVKVNLTTGSALIGYDEALVNADELMTTLEEHGWLTLPKSTDTRRLAEPTIRRNRSKDVGTTSALGRMAANAGGTATKVVAGMVIEKLVERAVVAAIGVVL